MGKISLKLCWGKNFQEKNIGEAHDGLFDAKLLLKVVEKYAGMFTPLDSMLDCHLLRAENLIALVKFHVFKIRRKRKKQQVPDYQWVSGRSLI